jgi:enhancing lycopene biosynthesis protein 2
MSSKKRVAVILSGCGVFDGSEIHEATLSLLALDQRGAEAVIAAPDAPQRRVFDHSAGAEVAGESRNCLVEAARIARGKIVPVPALDVASIDAVLLPGGFGAALNLSDLAIAGGGLTLEPTTARFLAAAHAAGRPLGALCISPPLLARVLKDAGVTGARLTIGNDPGTAAAIEANGQVHVACAGDSCVIDRANRVVTCPAYMVAGSIAELWKGIDAAVEALLAL